MRRCLPVVLALWPTVAPAQSFTDIYWELVAIDGKPTEARTTLRINKDNVLAGAAPCNRWIIFVNEVKLPALSLGPVTTTRMACDKMAEEQAFFDALLPMTLVQPDGDQTLILTGPEGRRMEFVRDGMKGKTACKSCYTGG